MCEFVDMNRKLLCKAGTTLMVVCLTLGLLMSKSLPDRFHNGGRILTADDQATEIVPTPKRWALRPGSFRDITENASDTAIGRLPQGTPLQAPENVSSPKQFLPPSVTLPPRSRKVSTLCTCNFSPNRLYIVATTTRDGYVLRQGGVSHLSGQQCSCMNAYNFRQRTAENAVIRCTFVYESDRRHEIPCAGQEFVYSSTSDVAGYYQCNGNPTSCVSTGYCHGDPCTHGPDSFR